MQQIVSVDETTQVKNINLLLIELNYNSTQHTDYIYLKRITNMLSVGIINLNCLMSCTSFHHFVSDSLIFSPCSHVSNANVTNFV